MKYKDNFNQGIDKEIWSLKRVQDNTCWETIQFKETEALKITVHHGDCEGHGNDGKITERTEFTERDEIQITTDVPVWYSFKVYFPEDFLISANRFVFAQWKQSTRKPESPYLSCRYINGEFIAQVVYDSTKINFPTKVDLRGKWSTILVYYVLRRDKTGDAKVWLNGKQCLDYSGKLGSSIAIAKHLMFKFGIYRDQIDQAQFLLFKEVCRGERREDVTPDL